MDQRPVNWSLLPEPVLLEIFSYLPVLDLLNCSTACKRWRSIGQCNFLWKKVFLKDFVPASRYPLNSNNAIANKNEFRIRPGATSWLAEYKRMVVETPVILSEFRIALPLSRGIHVSFSHNGKLFATCSKDGIIQVWESSYPIKLLYKHDMEVLRWRTTEYCEFNQSDTLLLVSGIYFGSRLTNSGEIAVFSIHENRLELRCRVSNRPFDILGTWFSDQHLISGEVHWLAELVSASVLWLNKADQEISSEHTRVTKQLYKFYNRCGCPLRYIQVAKCSWLNDPVKLAIHDEAVNQCDPKNRASSHFLLVDNQIRSVIPKRVTYKSHDPTDRIEHNIEYDRSIYFIPDSKRMQYDGYNGFEDVDDESNGATPREEIIDSDEPSSSDEAAMINEVADDCVKYLIFTMGSRSCMPHEIGFKRMTNVEFSKIVDPGPTLKERILKREQEKLQQSNEPQSEIDWDNFDEVKHKFDKIDAVIEMAGQIVGMCLSPDHRYLYVNCRSWPLEIQISDPTLPPPTATQVDMYVIDLLTLQIVGKMLSKLNDYTVNAANHLLYPMNTDNHIMYPGVNDLYVAFGAENKQVYLWDRWYGNCVAKFHENGLVSSVAFNPADPGMFITTTEQGGISVWRSKTRCKELNTDRRCYAHYPKIQ